jgi:hypothetical protein
MIRKSNPFLGRKGVVFVLLYKIVGDKFFTWPYSAKVGVPSISFISHLRDSNL